MNDRFSPELVFVMSASSPTDLHTLSLICAVSESSRLRKSPRYGLTEVKTQGVTSMTFSKSGRNGFLLGTFCFAAILSACSPNQSADSGDSHEVYSPKDLNAPFYVIKEYSPDRDPVADLATTVERATAEDKRILLVIGGEWCIWCHYLADFLEENAESQAAFDQSFVVSKINYSDENKNEDFLSQFPKAEGYPHFYILESDGSFLASQGTADLEKNKSYNPKKMIAFAEKWQKG